MGTVRDFSGIADAASLTCLMSESDLLSAAFVMLLSFLKSIRQELQGCEDPQLFMHVTRGKSFSSHTK